MAIEAYCVKCKAKKIMQDPVEGTTKNGKPITKGKCPDCGTTICRIGAAKKYLRHIQILGRATAPGLRFGGRVASCPALLSWMFHVKHFPSAYCE